MWCLDFLIFSLYVNNLIWLFISLLGKIGYNPFSYLYELPQIVHTCMNASQLETSLAAVWFKTVWQQPKRLSTYKCLKSNYIFLQVYSINTYTSSTHFKKKIIPKCQDGIIRIKQLFLVVHACMNRSLHSQILHERPSPLDWFLELRDPFIHANSCLIL